jgi:hypothetical protein
MLRENMKSRSHQHEDAHAHGPSLSDHAHGSADSHGIHSHSHAHSHGGAGDPQSAAPSASAPDSSVAIPDDMPLEDAIALARRIVGSIPPESPERLISSMREAGFSFQADLKSALQLDDVHIAFTFVKGEAHSDASGGQQQP